MSDSHESHLTTETLIAMVLLILFIISGPIFEKINFHYAHESGVVMICGILISLIVNSFDEETSFVKSLDFNHEMFFTLILPPIIFGAGYNLRRKFFFKYIFYILLFGVIGTVINFCFVAPLTYITNYSFGFSISNKMDIFDKNGMIIKGFNEFGENENELKKEESSRENPGNISNNESIILSNETSKKKKIERHQADSIFLSTKEILLFSSIISATDAVAALAFIKEDSDPKLFPILFGEGVVNDAVCIVLYQIIKGFLDSGTNFTFFTPFKMTGQFLRLFVFSLFVAILLGVISSLFFKKAKILKLSRVQECALVIFFALITYSLTEAIHFSPIVAILFLGIFMAQYTFFNLSYQAREESSVVTKMLSTIAEGFVFVYMGLTVYHYFTKAFSIGFVIWEFFILLLSRVGMVFGSCYFLENILKVKSFRMKFSDKGILAYSGTIRGAIAFGLACSLELDNDLHKYIIISGTLALVLFTTILLGALMPFWIAYMKSYDSAEDREAALLGAIIPTSIENDVGYDFSHPNFNVETLVSKEKNPFEIQKRFSYYITNLWSNYDMHVIRPWLIYDFPNCVEEHEQLSKKLLEASAEYTKEKNNKESINESNAYNEKLELQNVKIFNRDSKEK